MIIADRKIYAYNINKSQTRNCLSPADYHNHEKLSKTLLMPYETTFA